MSSLTFARFGPAARSAEPPAGAALPGHVDGPRLGELLREALGLQDRDLQRILDHAAARHLRFGDAAVALGLASPEQILQALTRQYGYAYTPYGQQPGHAAALSSRAGKALARPPGELVALTKPFTLQAEAFRAIRSQLLLRLDPEQPRQKVLAVVSHSPGDGKTFFSANLAVTLAQMGSRTLLIDADLRGPRQHRLFPVDNSLGLSGYLMGRAGAHGMQAVRQVPGLSVLPGGPPPPNPQELIERKEFGLLLHEARDSFDHVIVDTPAAAYGADAQVIANRCGRVLVLARKDRSRHAQLQRLSASMRETAALLVGVVFNEF